MLHRRTAEGTNLYQGHGALGMLVTPTYLPPIVKFNFIMGSYGSIEMLTALGLLCIYGHSYVGIYSPKVVVKS